MFICWSSYLEPTDFFYNSNKLYILFYGWVNNEDTEVYLMNKNLAENAIEEPVYDSGSINFIDLSQNYPNPFNPRTHITFSLNKSGFTTLKIYNIEGQLVKILIAEYKNPGEYSVFWNGANRNGNMVGSGIYFYRLETENQRFSRRAVLVR